MKRLKLSALIAVFFASGFLSSCSGHYIRNRVRDAADIFTAEASTRSYGFSARIGPVKAGVSYKDPKGYSGGLRGGAIGAYHTAEFTAMIFGADYFRSDRIPVIEPEENEENKEAAAESIQPEVSILRLREKEFQARSPIGTPISLSEKKSVLKEPGWISGYYYTQIEITAGLFLGIKIGINAGELLDFVLGWFTVDIFHDDAPYLGTRIRELQESPLWNELDDETKKKALEELNRSAE